MKREASITELLEAYRVDRIDAALLLHHFLYRIPRVPIEELSSVLDPDLRARFHMYLVSVSKPDWVYIDEPELTPEALEAIREYLRKVGKSSSGWPT